MGTLKKGDLLFIILGLGYRWLNHVLQTYDPIWQSEWGRSNLTNQIFAGKSIFSTPLAIVEPDHSRVRSMENNKQVYVMAVAI